MSLTVFWYRRDLRLDDNAGLYEALKKENSVVQPIFIFDTDILTRLKNSQDRRVPFIHDTIQKMKEDFKALGADLWVFHGKPIEVFQSLIQQNSIESIYCNHDYEPQAMQRDLKVQKLCVSKGIQFRSFKDQVVFEKDEVLTGSQKPYTVYTPYKKKWLASLSPFYLKSYPTEKYFSKLNRAQKIQKLPSLKEMGFERTESFYPKLQFNRDLIQTYAENRDFPALDATTRLGIHLRFGTLSVRKAAQVGKELSPVWLSELIWREFFMQVLFHFPHVEKSSFRPEYEKIQWRTSKSDFDRWCAGLTGYPLVDAGMRQMNQTGYMHNRVRMVTASFLTKHLLMHWSLGEKYFASQLLDYEMAANNGNWQWAAGTGCDAAPYFRVFNPESQADKFDPDSEYIRKWVPEFETSKYPKPMIDHKEARERALRAFYKGLKGDKK